VTFVNKSTLNPLITIIIDLICEYTDILSFMPVELLPLTFQESSVNQWVSGGVPAGKLIMGIPLYGRTYILADPKDHGLGAPINDSGIAGPYTKEPGFLSYYEVFQHVFL
jgi:GH18 family chitinase